MLNSCRGFWFRALVVALFLAASSAVTAAPDGCKSTATGDLRQHRLTSRRFGNTRTIRVLVPAGYDRPENASMRYPVLYLLDGQNLFDACLSDVSHHEWQVDETVGRLVAEGRIPPMIVVGIDHAGRDRGYEYLPYRDYLFGDDAREPAGRRFPDFLVDEVLPLVNQRYRTLTGRLHTGIGGSSYGAAAALFALLAKPSHFGVGLIESASLEIGAGQLVRDTSPLVAPPMRVFFGFGGREADDPKTNELLIGLLRTVESHFRAAGYDDSTLRVRIDPEAAHTEASWAARLPDALEFLYGNTAEH